MSPTSRKNKSFRVSGYIDLFISALLLVVALLLIFSAQLFLERDLKAWGNLLTTIGTLMISLVSLHMGSRINQARTKKEFRRQIRINETQSHREFLSKLSDLDKQIARAKRLIGEGKQNRGDRIFYMADEQLQKLLDERPSTNNISDVASRKRIEEEITCVINYLENFSPVKIPHNDLNQAILAALDSLNSYENLD